MVKIAYQKLKPFEIYKFKLTINIMKSLKSNIISF